MIRTVKSRIALWYGALFTVLFLIVFISNQADLRSRLFTEVDTILKEKAHRAQWFGNDVPIEKIKSNIDYNIKVEGLKKVFYQLYSSEGELIVTSDLTAWQGLEFDRKLLLSISGIHTPFSKKEIKAILPGSPKRFLDENTLVLFHTFEKPQIEYPFRVAMIRFYDGRVLVCGYSLRDPYLVLLRARRNFLIGFFITLAMGGVFGYLLAAKAMSGVNRVTRAASVVREGDLDYRVSEGREGQEIDNLAHAFNGMIERIQQLLTGMKQVTDDIAHDLRSPVTRIRNAAEMVALREPEDSECAKQTGLIVEECDRLVGMINTMLEITQTDSGVMTFDRKDMDFVSVVTAGYDLFLSVAEDKGIDFQLQKEVDEIIISADKTRIQRIIANLIDNALKFTPQGGSVILRLFTDDEACPIKVTFSVSDSGPGISLEEQGQIFDRFYRGDPSRTVDGNGLGLSLARSLAKAHGGDILVQSKPGEGSCFTLELPVNYIPG